MLLDGPLRRPRDSLTIESRQISALGLLEQCPVPVIAVADDGAVLFVSAAFAHLFGYSCDALTGMSYEDICSLLPPDETLSAVTRLGPNAFVGSLILSSQATIFVKMRKSATLSDADPDATAMFKELTEHLSAKRSHKGPPL
jgi:PAS domain-containing protein